MIIKGSHDSSAYTFDFTTSFWKTGKWHWLRLAASKCFLARYRINQMSKTQDKSICEQLQSGIRALDIRVAEKDGVYYSSHTFATIPFVEVLGQINKFMHTFKYKQVDEVDHIYVVIHKDFRSGHSVNDELLLQIIEATLDFKRVKCYYNGSCATAVNIQPITKLRIIWLNAQTVEEFMTKIATLQLTNDKINCLMMALTPELSAKTIFTGSLKKDNVALTQKFLTLEPFVPLIVFRDFV
jgi:hypothetical protein